MQTAEQQPGLFSNSGRSLEQDDEIQLLSVGVDIGSSTSHLVFSRLLLVQQGNRYVVKERHILFESDVLLTPYSSDSTIDADALGEFIGRQYRQADISPDEIDTGALILTGVAVRRSNARAIGDLFSSQAGKFVSVSAGDGLETNLVAYGSGAIDRSRTEKTSVLNVDIGGGTSKIAWCEQGELRGMTAIDVGARVVCFDDYGRITQLEEAGRTFIADVGLALDVGDVLSEEATTRIAERMAEYLFQAMGGAPRSAVTEHLLRLEPLAVADGQSPHYLSFSGGVSEYIYERETRRYGDLGPALARAVKARVEHWGAIQIRPREGFRATVVGASQYAVQVSGSTIFVSPQETLPLRNLAVLTPDINFADEISPTQIASAINTALQRLDLQTADQPIAVCYQWQGMASYRRLDQFCQGILLGLALHLAQGHPLVLVGNSDIGGLIGLHLKDKAENGTSLVSIDGIVLKEFDFIDIGAFLEASGSVPVVIKSLVFPSTTGLGRAGAAGSLKKTQG